MAARAVPAEEARASSAPGVGDRLAASGKPACIRKGPKTQQEAAMDKEAELTARFEKTLQRLLQNRDKEMDFSSLNLGPQQAQRIAGAMAQLRSQPKTPAMMTSLNLYDNKIGDEGLVALAAELQLNTTLRVLNLKWNHLGADNQVGRPENDAGITALCDALVKNPSSALVQINLEWNKIWLVGRERLAQTVSQTRFFGVDDGLPNPLIRKTGNWDFRAGKPTKEGEALLGVAQVTFPVSAAPPPPAAAAGVRQLAS